MKLTPAVIGIVVADMPASLAFYRRLGLEIPAGVDGEPHVEVDLGGVRLAFDTRETVLSFDSSWTEASGGPQMSLAFQAGSPAEVDEAYAALTGAGAEGHLEPWDAFWGMRYAMVHDPDGNGVDLFAPLS
jgi:catechol 2,3-dioxygenase-like lactoylglutathione lyase family enzyme